MVDRRGREPLSRAGAARRDLILATAIAALERRRRRRRAGRGMLLVSGACLVAVAAGLAARTWRTAPPRGGEPQVVNGGSSLQRSPPVRIMVVSNNHRTGRVRPIGDDELLQFLDQIDRPAGLVREGGSVRLTRPVVDEQPLQ